MRNAHYDELWEQERDEVAEAQQLLADLRRRHGSTLHQMNAEEDPRVRSLLAVQVRGLAALLKAAQEKYDEAVAVTGAPDRLPVRT